MGDGLADGRPDGSAYGRELRTAPLWGLRLMQRFLNGEALPAARRPGPFGRGGDSSSTAAKRLRPRDGFAALGRLARSSLLDFVSSR